MTTTETDLICNLATPQERQHRIDIRNSLIPYLTNISHSESATMLTFTKPQVTLALLEDFIIAERECCAFLQFEVSEEESHFQLSVAGPAGSEVLVSEFFADASKTASSRCGCANAPTQQKRSKQVSKFKSYFGGWLTLCVICCTAPYALVTFGFLSVSAGAYFGQTLAVLLIFGTLMVLSYFSWRHFKTRQTE